MISKQEIEQMEHMSVKEIQERLDKYNEIAERTDYYEWYEYEIKGNIKFQTLIEEALDLLAKEKDINKIERIISILKVPGGYI